MVLNWVMRNHISRRHERSRGALPFPPDPAAPRVGSAGVRSAAGTAAGAASGTANGLWSHFPSSRIGAGYRRPGSTVTAKTSCTAVLDRDAAGPGESHEPSKRSLSAVVALLPLTFVFTRVKVVSKA